MPSKALFSTRLLPGLLPVAREAGALIMKHYSGLRTAEKKEDSSPVTEADREADRFIVEALLDAAPAVPAVSEEGAKPDIAAAEYFWLIDPLDGTKSFVRGSGFFTVNIALIGPDRTPHIGVVYEPVGRMLYWGGPEGAFAQKDGGEPYAIHTRGRHELPLSAIVSHSHLDRQTEAWLEKNSIIHRHPCASSVKFCLLAEGKVDYYPRFGPTMEWDTAAGHAVLNAAGGRLTKPDGSPFTYGKDGFRNGNFVASGV